jgi:hypothetical protein
MFQKARHHMQILDAKIVTRGESHTEKAQLWIDL